MADEIAGSPAGRASCRRQGVTTGHAPRSPAAAVLPAQYRHLCGAEYRPRHGGSSLRPQRNAVLRPPITGETRVIARTLCGGSTCAFAGYRAISSSDIRLYRSLLLTETQTLRTLLRRSQIIPAGTIYAWDIRWPKANCQAGFASKAAGLGRLTECCRPEPHGQRPLRPSFSTSSTSTWTKRLPRLTCRSLGVPPAALAHRFKSSPACRRHVSLSVLLGRSSIEPYGRCVLSSSAFPLGRHRLRPQGAS